MKNGCLRPARYLFALCLYLNIALFAQGQSPDPNIYVNPNILSPKLAGLGEFGQIPVSLFYGQADISVPLYTLQYKDMEVPISLSYNTGGNRVDEFRSWVGLGWNLSAGGAIVRRTNWEPDERQFGHFNNYQNWDYDDWKTVFRGLKLDAADEFKFSFLGYTGSFFKDHKGYWQIKSKDASNFKIECIVQEGVMLEEGTGRTGIGTTIMSFVITTDDGTKYTFGGTQEAIEFTRSCALAISPGVEAADIVANAWHLVKIQNSKGEIRFKYKREVHVTATNYTEISQEPGYPVNNPAMSDAQDQNITRYYGNYESYLTDIEADQLSTITFNKSKSVDLKYPEFNYTRRTAFYMDPNTGQGEYQNLSFGLAGPMEDYLGEHWKLDNIQIKTVGQGAYDFIKFDYIDNIQERMKLQKITMFPSAITSEYTYDFEYNPLKLPSYIRGVEDHWGYYNGKNYWNSSASSSGVVPDLTAYYNSREPDPAFLQAEMLTKIKYPTGGSTELYYEPHEYSTLVKQYPNSLEDIPGKKIAGGLRVKKIVNRDGVSATPLIREFFYTRNYLSGGTMSSGILSGQPVYYEGGRIKMGNSARPMYIFSSTPLCHLSHTNGHHVTYSEVVEKSPEGGFTYYKYSNHDNGYTDIPAYRVSTTSTIYDYPASLMFDKIFSSRELERGLLLKSIVYDSSRRMLRKDTMEYNNDPGRYDKCIRTYSNEWHPGRVYIAGTYAIFTFWPYLSKKTETEYDVIGNSMSKVTVYKYDEKTRLLTSSSSQNSKSQYITSSYKYPKDFAGTPVYDEMVKRNMVKNVIELRVSSGPQPFSIPPTATTLSVTRNNYSLWNAGTHILPQSVQTATGNNPLTTTVTFKEYDPYGNLVESESRAKGLTAWLWGYNHMYPVAEVAGANYYTVKGLVDDAILNNLNDVSGDEAIMIELNKLRSQLWNLLVKTYSYRLGNGMSQEANANGRKAYYYYDNSHRLLYIKDNNQHVKKAYDYKYKLSIQQ